MRVERVDEPNVRPLPLLSRLLLLQTLFEHSADVLLLLAHLTAQDVVSGLIAKTLGDRSLKLTLRADRLTPHHFVVTAMDVAGQLGFTNLQIAIDRSAGTGE